jgi:hypothetical protein
MKRATAALTTAGAYFYLALPAFAQTGAVIDPCPKSSFNPLCSLKADKIGTIVQGVVTILLIIAVVISMFYLVFGGIKWVTSGGDKQKVESARNHIIAAIVGLVIAFLAYFILTVILSIFGLSISNIKLPKLGA